jgi:GTP cyclohydrolase FolE2
MFHCRRIKIRIAFVLNVCGPWYKKRLARLMQNPMTLYQPEIPATKKAIQVARFCGLMGASASLTTTCPCNLKLGGRFK